MKKGKGKRKGRSGRKAWDADTLAAGNRARVRSWVNLLGHSKMFGDYIAEYVNPIIESTQVDLKQEFVDVAGDYDFEGRDVIARTTTMEDGRPVLVLVEVLFTIDDSVSGQITKHALVTYRDFVSRVKGDPVLVYSVFYAGSEEWERSSMAIGDFSNIWSTGTKPKFVFTHIDFHRMGKRGRE